MSRNGPEADHSRDDVRPVAPGRRRRLPAFLLVGAVALAVGFGLRSADHGEPAAPPGVTQDRGATAPDRGSPSARATAPAAAVYMPGEFDAQDVLILGGEQLARLHPDVMTAIIEAAMPAVRIAIASGPPVGRATVDSLLQADHFPGDRVTIVELPILTMWVRDFGPLTVADATGGRSMVDFTYRERRGNTLDDAAAAPLAAALGLPLRGSRLLLEGGDLLSNGRGICVMSERVINRNAHYLGLEADVVVREIAATLGFENFSLVEPLAGEKTGHADMLCAFLAPDLIVVGRIDPAIDAGNAALLDRNAAGLRGLPTLDGPLRVERVPMPDHADGVWRTYTNIVQVNGVVLVPVYPDHCPDLDAQALAVYRRLLPDRRIVPIDVSGLIRMNGALRCVTLNVPGGGAPGAPVGR